MQTPRRPAKPVKTAKPASPPASKGVLHPRNRHQGRYDFAAMIKACPALEAFVIINPYGNESIEFANPEAVRVFNRALLAQLYGIAHWDIPAGYLCPPVPGRADYLHGLADLLAEDHDGAIPRGGEVRVLDVGSGANCIYPLLGHVDYGWQFVGSDIDPTAIAAARAIVQANRLQDSIELRLQANRGKIFEGVIQAEERFSLTLCNPPFHTSADEAASGSRRKWKNLGKQDPSRRLPALNFGGQGNELWCPGGELAFVRRMIEESRSVGQQVMWFSCLVSKAGNLPLLERALTAANVLDNRVVSMSQGQKQSRFLAWTFQDRAARRNV